MASESDRGLPAPPHHLLQNASLFLDFDGTLVALAARPDAIHVDDALPGLLTRLQTTLGNRVAVISGRPIADIRNYLKNENLIVAGSHGLEISWPDGRHWSLNPPPSLALVRDDVRELSMAHPGVLIEEKPFGVAIHYRQAPEAREFCRQRAIELSQRTNLRLQTGKMVFELKAPGADKGTAIDMLMRETPMLGYSPLFLGDDDTDEAGFTAVARMGGAGILVGPVRQTAAAYALPDVKGAVAWLSKASAAQ